MVFLRSILGSVPLVFVVAGALLILAPQGQAQTQEELHAQVDATNAQIQKLRDEIVQLQSQLTTTSAQKQTLQSAIKALDLQIQKLQKSVTLTTAQINLKDKEIGTLSGTIQQTEGSIDRSRGQVAESLRQLEALDGESAAVMLFGGGTLSSFFDSAVTLAALRGDLQNRIEDLSILKEKLTTNNTSAESKRRELATLQSDLNHQKQGLSLTKTEQNKLLTETKSKESAYQALIAQKKAEEEKFERELQEFEAKLGLAVAPGSLPAARAGVLQWPLSTVRITQYFGNTSFATQNPQVYGNRGHNAIDLAAGTGSAVKAARGGTVLGTGNTDTTCPNASYGKWVFIKHDNGLSTLYAHLSTISVSQGDKVDGGELIGYSGNTGYSTGPHLHFGVYASSGSKISTFPSSSCRGKSYTMPVADPTAYLNPLSYLPSL